MVDKGTDLLRRADLKAYSFRETLGKSKVLTFYDIRLQANLAAFYLEAGLAALKEAAADPQLRGIASYYLGEAHAMAGNSGEAATAMAAFLASSQTPAPYRNRAFVRQAEIQYRLGRRTEAMGRWEELARTHAKDPDLLADIVSACGRLRIDCPRPAEAAAAAAEAGEGKRFAALNIGLGAYHRGRKDTARALAFLEAGRDKGNKNKIEFNDPLMLTALADSYYRTKKFSESLEILFEMSKQFPQVRQIQESLQGIYSMEHKSAGDVKIN
jgi:tetratricopeptide (TPR) repeat protein